jgi:hypothetical protein
VFLARAVEIADCRLWGTSGLRQRPRNFNFMINGEMRNLEIIWVSHKKGCSFSELKSGEGRGEGLH